jgi:stage II sporulation protein AB (anti-sigma F factor)
MGEDRQNHMKVCFDARSVNEGFARMTAAAFLTGMNPTLEQVEDVKTAVSEAVTNAIVHGCTGEDEQVELECVQEQERLTVSVTDHGVGIADIEQAMQPFFTSKPQQERTGMGFAFMEAFMDEVHVDSAPGNGTKVTMVKYIEGVDER